MTTQAVEAFALDEATHVYTLGREVLESPSSVLQDLGLVDPRWFTAEARQRGKVVHAVLAGVLQGLTYNRQDLHQDLHGYVDSGMRLIDRLKPQLLEVERPRFHPLYKFAGTMDLRVLLGECEWIWDWKTGKVVKVVRFQTAAYDILAGPAANGRQRRRAALELQEDGSIAKIVEFPGFTDGGEWLGLLTATRIRRQSRRAPLVYTPFADADIANPGD